MSDFHPETWVPAWSVASILNGVLSFMLESTPTVGSVEASFAERRRLALASHAFNRKVPIFCELFPQLVVAADDSAGDETGGDGPPGVAAADGAADVRAVGEPNAADNYNTGLLLAGVLAAAVALGCYFRGEM